MPEDLNKKIQVVLEANYGMTFTQIANQALRAWLEKPEVIVISTPVEAPKKGRIK